MKTRWLTALGLVTVGSAGALGGCSDSASNDTGSAGTGGGSAGSLGSLAGTSNAGSATAGATSGGANGSAGSATAGSATAGSAGAGGGGAGGGGAGGAGGAGGGGAGGASGAGGGGAGGGEAAPKLVYDFETDVQGWASTGEGVTVATDTAQKVTGTQSLKFSVPALAPDASRNVAVGKPLFWPGTILTLHVYSPAGPDGLWLQAYTQSNNWAVWDTAGNTAVSLVRGGWTTIKYTVPQTFPGGLQSLGVQLGVDSTGVAFAGGDFYIDSVTAEGGVESCAGTGTGSLDFEAVDITAWNIDGAPADTAIAHSTEQANGGTGALKVSLTALPGGTPAAPTARRIRLDKPIAYCTQQVTLNVRMPAGSEDLSFQAFSQFNNYDGWNAAEPPATITRDGWTEQTYTLPAIGPGGLQMVGVQILNTGEDAFTGDVYIDDVSW